MGFGLPAAVAASLASPGRPVVALVGDGGLGMTGAELETAVREGARPVVLVFDNARYGTIHDHQSRRGLAPIATELGAVDWAMVAEGFGAAGVRVETDDEFEPALRAALGSRRPTVLHLVIDRRWVSVDRLDDAAAVLAVDDTVAPGEAVAPSDVDEPGAELGPSPSTDHEPEPAGGVDPVAQLEPGADPEAGDDLELTRGSETETDLASAPETDTNAAAATDSSAAAIENSAAAEGDAAAAIENPGPDDAAAAPSEA
jgi:hypothetical protein